MLTFLKSHILEKSSGLIFVAIIASISYAIVALPWMAKTGMSALIIAILLGMVIGNSWSYPSSWRPGVIFAAKRLLRLAIIFYGFRISFQQVMSVGMKAIVIDVGIVISTLILGFWVGRKVFKLDRELALLISAGAAICGAAAVLAVEEILKSESYKAAVAVGTVVLFGTLSMFLYPMLQQIGLFGFTSHQFGIFTGASIHEVAQVIVAGSQIDVETGKIAVIVKMVRVILLVPVLFLLAFCARYFTQSKHSRSTQLILPWFALGFIFIIAFNSLQLLPSPFINLINQFDTLLLTMAMTAIGLETQFSKIKKVGLKPLYLAGILFIWLLSSAAFLVK